jgi:hypothetical protein
MAATTRPSTRSSSTWSAALSASPAADRQRGVAHARKPTGWEAEESLFSRQAAKTPRREGSRWQTRHRRRIRPQCR